MNLLEKTWIRIIASLFGGSLIVELINLSSENPNRPTNIMAILILATILFGLFTWIVNRKKKNS